MYLVSIDTDKESGVGVDGHVMSASAVFSNLGLPPRPLNSASGCGGGVPTFCSLPGVPNTV